MLDLVGLCKARRIAYISEGHHHCHDGWIQLHCPFCAGGRSGWHLGFHLNTGALNCWRCGPLKTRAVVAALLHTTDESLIFQTLREFQKASKWTLGVKKDRARKIELPPGCGRLRMAHRRYLRRRRFNAKRLTKRWSLQGIGGQHGPWSWRIVAPVLTGNGVPMAYLGRSISDTAKPKYKMSDEADITVDPRILLYGLHLVPADTVVIVEGPSDVWRLGPGAVATLGIDWKLQQADLLRHYSRRFIVFDPDKLAQRKAQQLAEWLSMFSGETEIIDGLSSDPGDLSDTKARKLMRMVNIEG